jgi:hypothetical protein
VETAVFDTLDFAEGVEFIIIETPYDRAGPVPPKHGIWLSKLVIASLLRAPSWPSGTDLLLADRQALGHMPDTSSDWPISITGFRKADQELVASIRCRSSICTAVEEKYIGRYIVFDDECSASSRRALINPRYHLSAEPNTIYRSFIKHGQEALRLVTPSFIQSSIPKR